MTCVVEGDSGFSLKEHCQPVQAGGAGCSARSKDSCRKEERRLAPSIVFFLFSELGLVSQQRSNQRYLWSSVKASRISTARERKQMLGSSQRHWDKIADSSGGDLHDREES